MKFAASLLAGIALIVCLFPFDRRPSIQPEMVGEAVRTAHANTSPDTEKRSGAKRDLIGSSTTIENGGLVGEQGSHLSKANDGTNDSTDNQGRLDETSLSDEMIDDVDKTVVGRPLNISPATMPTCVKGEDESDCEDARRIEQFTGEPRDPAWADRAESMLRSMAELRNSGFLVRNLECRLTTCIVEVESASGFLSPEEALKPNEWRAVKVKPFRVRVGDENSSQGRKVTVTLWIYQRIR